MCHRKAFFLNQSGSKIPFKLSPHPLTLFLRRLDSYKKFISTFSAVTLTQHRFKISWPIGTHIYLTSSHKKKQFKNLPLRKYVLKLVSIVIYKSTSFWTSSRILWYNDENYQDVQLQDAVVNIFAFMSVALLLLIYQQL